MVAPSILSSDFGKLIDECKDVISKGADWLHIDIMDGHFVPNLTIGPSVVICIRKALPHVFLDCHLMVSNPFKWIKPFAEAGATSISFHWECFSCKEATLALVNVIHSFGCKAAMAIKPQTEISQVEEILSSLDMLLIMTVEPGFGGQAMLTECLDKVEHVKRIQPGLLVQVDGGIAVENSEMVRSKGVDIIVAGTAIFKAQDREVAIRKLSGRFIQENS